MNNTTTSAVNAVSESVSEYHIGFMVILSLFEVLWLSVCGGEYRTGYRDLINGECGARPKGCVTQLCVIVQWLV